MKSAMVFGIPKAWPLRVALFLFLAAQLVSAHAWTAPRYVEICSGHGITLVAVPEEGGAKAGEPPCLVCQSCCNAAFSAAFQHDHIEEYIAFAVAAAPQRLSATLAERRVKRARAPPDFSA